MNPRINLNDLALERRDNLDLLPETDVTDTAPFRASENERYWTTLPGEIHDNHLRGRTGLGTPKKPSPMAYDEFIILRI